MSKARRIALLGGLESSQLRQLSYDYVAEVLKPALNPAVWEFVKARRQTEDKIVIVSAALAEYIEPLAESLGIDKVIAARLSLDLDDVTTGSLQVPLVFGDKKVAEMKKYERELADEVSTWYRLGFSDSYHDLSLLEWVDEAYVIEDVCPVLTDIARKRKWKLL